MRVIFHLTSFAIIIATLASCNWLTSPEELKPGRRDYVWEEDTIRVPEGYYTDMARIWGSYPNNVWICGHAFISDHTIWHYDGEGWENLDMNRFITPFAVYGFSENDVWFGTLESNIWHWDGRELSLFGNYTLPDFDDINIQSMWGPNPSEVYAVGYGRNIAEDQTVGIIMRYDGSNWKFDEIYEERLTFLKIRKQINNNLYFVNSYSYDNAEFPYKMFIIQNNSLNKIYESNRYIGLEELAGNIYMRQGKQLHRYDNNGFELWNDFNDTDYVARMWGRTESDYFTLNSDGLGHHNGSELITIYKTEYRIENVQLFEEDIFILCYDRGINHNIIIRGKLN